MTTNDIESVGKIPLFLLKTKSTPNDVYEDMFSASTGGLQFSPVFVPVLAHQLREKKLDWIGELLKARDIGPFNGPQMKYGGMIFTSQRAVEAFAKVVSDGSGGTSRDAKGWPHLQNTPIYTVGPATSRALRAIPQDPPLQIFGEEMGNGEALAHFIQEHYVNWYPERFINPTICFLVGDQRRDIIPKTLMAPGLAHNQVIRVDEHVVYGTDVMQSFEEDFSKLLDKTKDESLRWVVVFSPSGCEAMLRALGMLDPKTGKVKEGFKSPMTGTYIATIGPTTRDYLRKQFDYEADVCAKKPSPEGVADGIRSFMEKISSQNI